MKRSLVLFAALTLLAATSPALAITVSTEENFNTDAANWRQNSSATTANWVSSGGPNGASDSYVTSSLNLAKSTSATVVFRANDAFNASGDAFVGNWVTAGADTFSFWFKHDAPANLTVGARWSPIANFPGLSILTSLNSIAPNTWTPITFALDPNNPNWINAEGAGPTIPEAFYNTFSSVANLQILVQRDAALIPENTTVTFSLDHVSVVPEPSSLFLAAAGGLGMLLIARRRRAA